METAKTFENSHSVSNKMIWTSRILGIVANLFLLTDALMKVFKAAVSVEGTVVMGWSEASVPVIGIILLVCTILYIIPRTSFLGALLLTAYLGGAVASMMRVGIPFFFPIIMGVLIWIALYFRDEKVRRLISFK